METKERRYTGILEVRAAGEGSDDLVLEGYAAVFDIESQLWPGRLEVVRRGAFAQTIQGDDIMAYWAHDMTQVLGRKSAGTLSLEEDAKGLKVQIRMANNAINQARYDNAKRGEVKGMSIGFIAQPDGQQFSLRPDGTEIRELTRVMLIEVSPHPEPQFPETELEARAKVAWHGKKVEEPAAPVDVAHAQARVRAEAFML